MRPLTHVHFVPPFPSLPFAPFPSVCLVNRTIREEEERLERIRLQAIADEEYRRRQLEYNSY